MNKTKKTYNNNNKEGFKKNNKTYNNNNKNYEQEKPSNNSKTSFSKNPSGFLVVSLFVRADTPQKNIIEAIEGAVAIDHKKKVVISFEDDKNKQLISSIKSKFSNAFGVLFFNPKTKLCSNSTVNASKVHTEVLHAFKSSFFLTLDANVVIRQYSVEKMLSFISKEGDTVAVSPKFYSPSSEIVKTCRRFPSVWNFMSESSDFIKTKNLEHFMMERGDIGYYSIHRIDYSTLDCMLFLTDQLLKVKSFTQCYKNADLRDASFCKKLYKKSKGKIIFYPHARVLLNKNNFSEMPSLSEKLKYLLLK